MVLPNEVAAGTFGYGYLTPSVPEKNMGTSWWYAEGCDIGRYTRASRIVPYRNIAGSAARGGGSDR